MNGVYPHLGPAPSTAQHEIHRKTHPTSTTCDTCHAIGAGLPLATHAARPHAGIMTYRHANQTEAPTKQCAHLHSEDAAYGTDPLSPLHHDNRCPLHGRGPLGPNSTLTSQPTQEG